MTKTINTPATITRPEQLDADKRAALDAHLIDLATDGNPNTCFVYFAEEDAEEAAAWLQERHGETIAARRVMQYWTKTLKKTVKTACRERFFFTCHIDAAATKIACRYFREMKKFLAQLEEERLDAPEAWQREELQEAIAWHSKMLDMFAKERI